MIAYVFFSTYFIGFYYLNKEATLRLHTAFIVIFLFALAESILWFTSYTVLNITGEPYCCPFPPLVVASLVLQVFRQTFSRCLLLVVCLGYGIVRPKLMNTEWVAVFVVSLLYLICACISQTAVIMFAQDASANYGVQSNAQLLPYKLPEMFLDLVFIGWIYLAIGSTIRILTEFQQTVKLAMYKQLVSIIGVFVALFTFVTLIFMLSKCCLRLCADILFFYVQLMEIVGRRNAF